MLWHSDFLEPILAYCPRDISLINFGAFAGRIKCRIFILFWDLYHFSSEKNGGPV